MGTINRFEDLFAWQESRKLTNAIFEIFKSTKNVDYVIQYQIKRSAISIMANIAEGFGRHTTKENRQFYTLARGSLTETQSHLYVLKDSGILSQTDFDKIYIDTVKFSKLINGLIKNSLRLEGKI